MALPPRVQADLEAADALLAQMQTPSPPDEEDASPAAPVVTDDVPPAAPAVASAPPAPEPPVAAPAPPTENWEHKYRTLQGMHNRNMEVYRDRTERLETQVAELNRKLEAAKQPSTPPAPPEDTTKDAEVFGTDLVDMVKRTVNGMFGALAQQFNTRLSAVEAHLQGTSQSVAQTADEVFLGRLGALVPDYEAVNQDPDFLAWLGEVDPVYGLPRQAALTAASEARDVNRVAGIFVAFKATKSAPITAPAPTPAASLERQVAPRASGSAPATQQTKPIFSTAQVQQFYRAVQRGEYRGREAEAQRLEDQFNEALAEGRILG